MSDNDFPPTPEPWTDPTVRRRSINKRIFTGIGIGVLFFAGVGIGAASSSDGETVTETKTVEVEVPGPTETVEVEVPGEDVEVVPDVCIDALDDAEGVVHFVADMLGDMDFSDAANTQLGELVDVYNGSSLGCRILHETNK